MIKKVTKSFIQPAPELLDVNGRHLGFTFLIGRMTEVPAPDMELTGLRWLPDAPLKWRPSNTPFRKVRHFGYKPRFQAYVTLGSLNKRRFCQQGRQIAEGGLD